MAKPRLPFREYGWTPELAYVVGLLVTDGNLSSDGYHIVFRLSDYQLIETFKKCLNLNNLITEVKKTKTTLAQKPSYRIQFGNIQLYRWLLTIGLTPAKTLTIGSIKIPNNYFRDFLRGHLDGDGSVYTYEDNYNIYKGKRYRNTRVYTKFLSASESHIRWLYSMVSNLSPAKGIVEKHDPNRGTPNRATLWQIKCSKYESIKLLRWLFYRKDLPTLQRKRIIAEKILSAVDTKGKLIRLAS